MLLSYSCSMARLGSPVYVTCYMYVLILMDSYA
jgi:hypothetical protein